MDKRQTLIMVASLGSIFILAVTVMVAYKAFMPTCELIAANSQSLITNGNKTFHKSQPILSSDSSLLIKLSAHLEYRLNALIPASTLAPSSAPLLSSEDSLISVSANHQVVGASQSIVSEVQASPLVNSPIVPLSQGSNGATSNGLFGLNTNNNNDNNQQQQLAHPDSRSSSQNKLHSRPIHNVYSNGNTATKSNATSEALSDSSSTTISKTSNNKQFLPLELERVQSNGKLDGFGRQNYTLVFNCSKITLSFTRRQDRVFVDHVSLNLSIKNKKKSNCQLKTVNSKPELWSSEYHGTQGLANYACDKANLLRYTCYHGDNSILDLQIHGLQYMIARNTTAYHPIENKFDSSIPTKQC